MKSVFFISFPRALAVVAVALSALCSEVYCEAQAVASSAVTSQPTGKTKGDDRDRRASSSPWQCEVTVRAVSGTADEASASGERPALKEIKSSSGQMERSGGQAAPPISFPKELSDIQEQLSALPFSQFQVVDSLSFRSGVPGELTSTLRDLRKAPQKLTLRLRGCSRQKRVGFDIQWFNAVGKELLSTRVKVSEGNAVVVGAEPSFVPGEGEVGMIKPLSRGDILAITVNCSDREL